MKKITISKSGRWIILVSLAWANRSREEERDARAALWRLAAGFEDTAADVGDISTTIAVDTAGVHVECVDDEQLELWKASIAEDARAAGFEVA